MKHLRDRNTPFFSQLYRYPAAQPVVAVNGIISDAIGGISTKLQNNGFTKLADVTAYLETERVKSSFRSGVIIASHVSSKLLAKIISDPRATDVVYVPWAPEELQEYLDSHKSVEI